MKIKITKPDSSLFEGDAKKKFQISFDMPRFIRAPLKGGAKVGDLVVLYDGNTIRKNIHGVTQVPRSFSYIGSNRHRYALNSYSYRIEARKEEEARAKWQKLYDEAVRQENAEHDANRAVETAAASVEISNQDVEDVLNVGKMIFKVVERD